MADQLDLAIVLKAILDAKGFEQAQTAIKGLASQANSAAGPLSKTGDAGKKMGESLGGTRGPIADVTRVLLQNIGVTGAAGEAAKAAGTAMYFLEGATTATNVAIGASVAVFALALPWVIEWARGNKDAGQAQKDFSAALGISLEQLQDVVEKAPGATRELQALLGAMRSERARSQTDTLKEMAETVKKNKAEIAGLEHQIGLWNAEMRLSAASHERLRPRVDDSTQAVARLKQENEGVVIKARALEQAILDGTTVGEQAKVITDALADADRKAKEAADARAKAQRDLNEDLEEGRRGQLETKMRDIQGALATDSDALAKKEKKQKDGVLTEDLKRLLVLGDAEAQQAAERQRLADEEAARERQAVREKRANDAVLIAGATQALASFFGNNKAARIAAAIADTYAGATRAFADYPWPASAVIAGTVIAQGLANVANIRKQELGFDDPFNDILAEKLGRKSAADFVKHFGVGFQGGMGGGGGPTNVYHQSTTINRSVNYGGVSLPGFYGAGRTQMEKQLTRRLQVAQRLEDRTTVGRPRR